MSWLTSAVGSSIFSGIATAQTGGTGLDALKQAAISFGAALAFKGIGKLYGEDPAIGSLNWGKSSLAHGLVGGGMQVAEGNNFLDGFVSGVAQGAIPVDNIGGRNTALSPTLIAERTAAAAVIGGTVAAATGGDFVNGARTAAYGELYNESADWLRTLPARAKANVSYVEAHDWCHVADGKDPTLLMRCELSLKESEALAMVFLGFDDVSVAESSTDILKPGGELIGRAGSDETIRELPGGTKAAEEMFARLTKNASPIENTTYKGQAFEPPEGGFIGYRAISKSGPATIDVNIPGLEDVAKLKFLENY
jgi:hypothetical protein